MPGDPPACYEEQRVPHGTVHVHKYASKSLGVTRGLYVYTPPGYEENPQAKYPALFATAATTCNSSCSALASEPAMRAPLPQG